mgnify:CR=1 FL=1
MKILYLCSTDKENHLLFDTFKSFDVESMMVMEDNKKNKLNLVKKKFKKLNIFQKILYPLDLIAIFIFKISLNKFLTKKLNLNNYKSDNENKIIVSNINNQSVYEKIVIFDPDVVIVRGTSIIKKPLINFQARYFLNIHGGIVPNYRNVHSQFWSYYFRDFKNMGSSILHITEGVDNGNIALISKIKNIPKSLRKLYLETFLDSKELLNMLINDLVNGKKLNSIPQNKNIQAFYGKTPGIKDFIYLFFRQSVHKID